MHEAIEHLKQNGWSITTSRSKLFRLPAAIVRRYGETPAILSDVLTGLKECVSPDQKSWLLCRPDYAGTIKSAFKWNEWELKSIESADGDGDLIAEITAFWDIHLPVYVSVRDGYSHAAMRIVKPNAGCIVVGHEPEFEEASVVAKSFPKFLATL